MKVALGYKYDVSIETITPVSVGSGDTLTPFSDFWVYKDTAYLLDQDKFQKALEENPEYIKTYIDKVKVSKGKKDSYLYDFIKYKLRKNPKEFILKEIKIIGKGNATKLKACVKEAGKLLVPGSTIKGAIKSVLLYNWLMKEEQKNNITNTLAKLNSFQLSKIELMKEITDLVDLFIERMDKTQKRMNFSLMQIGDAYFEKTSSVYIHTIRHPLKYNKNGSEKNKIPIFVEAIGQKESSTSTLFLEENKVAHSENTNINHYFERKGIISLFSDINRYSLDNILYEKACVQRKSELSDYLKKLNDIQDLIKNAKKNEAFIPLGFGKTNFYQSIGLALFNWINKIQNENEGVPTLTNSFKNSLNIFFSGKKNQKEFPLTRALIEGSQHPLGWVKLTINE